jgi:hypothetical protein
LTKSLFHEFKAPAEVFAVAISLVTIAFQPLARAQETNIGFDDPQGLIALRTGERNPEHGDRDTFVFDPYNEDGMVFVINVVPPDFPALEPGLIDHYHLGYEELELNDPANHAPATLPDPENHGRYLGTMLRKNVVQMTYHPNNISTPQPFSLLRIRVLHNRLDVGTKSATGRICVYNNLTEGIEWGLTGDCAANIIRATFETPNGVPNFGIGASGSHAGQPIVTSHLQVRNLITKQS